MVETVDHMSAGAIRSSGSPSSCQTRPAGPRRPAGAGTAHRQILRECGSFGGGDRGAAGAKRFVWRLWRLAARWESNLNQKPRARSREAYRSSSAVISSNRNDKHVFLGQLSDWNAAHESRARCSSSFSRGLVWCGRVPAGGSDVSSSDSSMNSSGERSDASLMEDAGVNTLKK